MTDKDAINSLNKPTDEKYNRNLSLLDLFFAGYGFIVGAGIFSLIPYIIKQGKGISWLSFVVGGVVCLITGLSYAKLNSLYPSNDAEYSWILNILNFDEERNPDKVKPYVKYLANTIIWIVVIVGLFMGATILVGQADFIKEYVNISKQLLTLILVIFPSLIVMIGNKYATGINKTIMILVTGAFSLLVGLAKTYGKKGGEIRYNATTRDFSPLLKSSFITIFAYNGFQSIVQLSEESKERKFVPLSIIGSSGLAIGIYALITISVVALIGVKAAGNSVSPLADAYGVGFGSKGKDIVNLLALVALTNTMLILTLSRSRLLQKLAVRGIAPGYLKKLTSLKKLLRLEKFESNAENSNNAVNNANTNNVDNTGKTIPIYAVVTLSVISYILTFIGKGAVDHLAGITTSFLFIVFLMVNILVLINHYKKKTPAEKQQEQTVDKEIPILKGYPWYAIIGVFTSTLYLSVSGKYLNLMAPKK
jgi:basic amino acid/polyamine antiporter, APA family